MSTPEQVFPALTLPDLSILEKSHPAPHAFIRSALFSSRQFSGGAVRPWVTRVAPITVHALTGYQLQQVGGQKLDQGDGEVFNWLLSRVYQAGCTGKSEAVDFFTAEEALRELGRERGSESLRRLHESLNRLYEADLVYRIPGWHGRTRLLSSVGKPADEVAAAKFDYSVTISGRVGDFFRDGFKLLNLAERRKLDNYLSRWLYDFYSSHAHPFHMSTGLIKRLADRENMQESKWLALLNKSLAKLKRVTGWSHCEVREGKIVVQKPPPKPRRPAPATPAHDDDI